MTSRAAAGHEQFLAFGGIALGIGGVTGGRRSRDESRRTALPLVSQELRPCSEPGAQLAQRVA